MNGSLFRALAAATTATAAPAVVVGRHLVDFKYGCDVVEGYLQAVVVFRITTVLVARGVVTATLITDYKQLGLIFSLFTSLGLVC